MKSKFIWMVRAGEGAYLIDEFLKQGIVAIGWNEIGDLTEVKTLEEIKEKLRKVYPTSKLGQINNYAGQIFRFRFDFKIGDRIISYNPVNRTYHIAEIVSDYFYNEKKLDYYHQRKVKWFREIPRDILSTRTKNTLGSTLTIFKITNLAANELMEINIKPNISTNDDEDLEKEDETLDTLKEEIEAKAHEFVKDKILQLSWEEMQELVAGILRGMGYKTMVSQKGADRGKDIIASPDGLGLENPKIKVEVKHRNGSMGSSEIRSFLGGLRPNDRGLYVSTGGFTKDAKYEAERANVPLTLIDTDLLVRLIIQHYDNFDSDTRALIPLKKIYWPI